MLDHSNTKNTIYDINDPFYWDKTSLYSEMDRVYDICIGCRLCFNLCPSFPSMFESIDNAGVRKRDIAEKEGRVENSNHIPRGMLEFWLDPESPYFKEGRLDMNKEMVLFCAGGMRSALAAKTLKDMGFENVSHIDGGFGALRNSKFKIV